MSIFLKKVVAIAALPLAAGGLLVGLMSAAPALAADMPDSSATATPLASETGAVSAETTSVPWCGWTVSGLPGALTLKDKAATAEAPSKYMGEVILLGGTKDGIAAFVSGDKTAVQTNVKNCSWYGDANKQGLTMTVAASSAAFTASAKGAGVGGADVADAGMGFSLDTIDNALTIDPTYAPSCSSALTTNSDLSVYLGHETSTPLTTLNKSLIDTTSACTWGLAYAANIPAGLMPKFGNKLYTFTGPTLTTTVNIN